MVRKVLCVCKGNGDRSPLMAAVLKMYLKNAGLADVVCESAGVLEAATKGGGPAPEFAVVAAKRIGIDLSGHRKHQLDPRTIGDYDLFVCVDEEVAARVLEAGAKMQNIYNAQIGNPWPCQFQEDYDQTAERIMAAMYRVVIRYFSR